MASSLLQATEAVAEQEVRSEQRQDRSPRGPSEAVRLVYADAAGPQRPQGGAAAFPAASHRHQDDAEGTVERAKPPPHLTELSQEGLQKKEVNISHRLRQL